MKYYLSLLLLALAGPLTAQTTPPAAAAPPQPGAANWYIFNQPLPATPSGEKPVTKEPKADRSVIINAKPAPPVAEDVRPTPAVAPAAPARPATRVSRVAQAHAPYQGPLYVPLDPNTYRLMDRYAIKYGPDSLQDPHTSVRPYARSAAAHLGERLLDGGTDLSAADRFNAQYLVQDNWMFSPPGDSLNQSRQPFLKYFYRDQTDFYHVQTKDFSFRLNPVLLLQAGKDGGDNSLNGLRYVNTRGIAIEGLIDNRLGFYSFLTDNQEAVPGWVQNRIVRDTIMPHEGYWKYFKTEGGSAYDFFTARGGITYAVTKHINIQLAHDRNFIGNGYRSLILSDFSAPYFFLKINTRIWKLNYQNLFAELTAERKNVDQLYPKKYLALHHLSFDVNNNFNIGVFESIVQGAPGRGPEIQYLNPIIFYKAIDQQVGSADKALLGADFRWNIQHRAQIYGQLIINEFRLQDILNRTGWAGNKQGVQLGAKLLDLAGIRNLDLQLEVNYIRPYTYQAKLPYTLYLNYTQYQQPLAHPMGANLTEVLGVLSYQPLPRLNLLAKALYTVQGLDYGVDANGLVLNYGGNPLFPYTSAPQQYDNRTGQGNKSYLLHADLTASYQPRLNLFLDATLIVRHQTYLLTPATNGTEIYPSVALRWNIAQRLHEF